MWFDQILSAAGFEGLAEVFVLAGVVELDGERCCSRLEVHYSVGVAEVPKRGIRWRVDC